MVLVNDEVEPRLRSIPLPRLQDGTPFPATPNNSNSINFRRWCAAFKCVRKPKDLMPTFN